MRFTIRDLMWATVVVSSSVGWWRDHRALSIVDAWWEDHCYRYHFDNPNAYKRLIERERPPR